MCYCNKYDVASTQVVPGELTVVTGVPNSGKSEWIDALLCNLNESVGWKFALCSMENKVRLLLKCIIKNPLCFLMSILYNHLHAFLTT